MVTQRTMAPTISAHQNSQVQTGKAQKLYRSFHMLPFPTDLNQPRTSVEPSRTFRSNTVCSLICLAAHLRNLKLNTSTLDSIVTPTDPFFFRAFSEMEDDGAVTLYSGTAITDPQKNPFSIKVGLAQMLRGGAILEVTDLQQAKIAEEAGARSIAVTEPVSRGIRRMPDPSLIKNIKSAVSIPVMVRARVGHFVEAQILESIGVDYIDESEILAPADEDNFINKHNFGSPFICGCRNLGEALRRIREGAAMIRTQGEIIGQGNIAETVRNVRNVMKEIRILNNMDEDEVFSFAKKIAAPYDLVAQTKQMGRLPVVQFAAGGIVTPADAALMMQLGCDGIFVGNEVFGCNDPYKRIRAVVQAVRHYNDPHVLVESSCGLEESMAKVNLTEDRIEQSAE